MITTTSGTTNNSVFINRFIDKYTQLAVAANTIINYTHNFSDLNNIQSKTYSIYKVPTRDIYVYTGTDPLVLSDDGMRSGPFASVQNLTVIAPNADVVVFTNLEERTIMLLTKKDLRFAGGSLVDNAQEVNGIFVSSGYA